LVQRDVQRQLWIEDCAGSCRTVSEKEKSHASAHRKQAQKKRTRVLAHRDKHRDGGDDGCRSRCLIALRLLATEQRRRQRKSAGDGSGPTATRATPKRRLR